MKLSRWIGASCAVAVAALVSSCGGGGGNPGLCMASAQTCAELEAARNPQVPVIAPSSAWENVCTVDGEKQFTRSLLNEEYLWYREMPRIEPSQVATVPDYFYSLLTPQLDSRGQYKDQFSFIVTTKDADSLLTGSNVGYGVRWLRDDQGRIRVAFVDAGSPAQLAGLARGGVLVDAAAANADWFPNGDSTITFSYADSPGATPRSITLTTAPVQEDPVPLAKTLTTGSGRRVAYLLFNAHTLGAQDKLIPALQSAKAAGAQDVVLDMRYNGGGYLYTAQSLASMLTGPANDGSIFEELKYNDKIQPYTGEDQKLRFTGNVVFGESAYGEGAALPRLQMPRVYVLATGNTCSASESVINGLRGIGVEVVLIGGTTCGKPYGFPRIDNCGWSYFAITFQGINAQGFGDYPGGFAPTCAVRDDFDHALGSTSERLLSAALEYVDTGTCPATAAAQGQQPRMSPVPFTLKDKRSIGKILPSRR